MSALPGLQNLRWSVVALTHLAAIALALDPHQPVSNYLRKDFTVEDGLPANQVNEVVQTDNGFLWVATDAGLARFDGQRFTLIRLRDDSSRELAVHSLLATPEGSLWVGTDSGLKQIPKVALDHYDRALVNTYHPGAGQNDQIMCLQWSRNGTVWVGTNRGLYILKNGKLICLIPDDMISRLEEASNGHMLIITSQGFAEWDGSRVIRHPEVATELGVKKDQVFHVFEDHSGAIWYCTATGVARRVNGNLQRLPLYEYSGSFAAYRVYEDSRGSIFINTNVGLFRAVVDHLESLKLDFGPRSTYADRDGDLWLSSSHAGLIRLKDQSIRMYTTADGLPSNVADAVLADYSGALWVGSNCGGLSRFDGGRFTTYGDKEGLTNSCIWSLAEDVHHDLWVATWGGGIYRFRNGRFTQYSTTQGLPSDVATRVIAANDGSIWIATAAGLVCMENGAFRTFSRADGLLSDRISAIYQDHRGVIWVGTGTGIQRLSGGRFVSVGAPVEAGDLSYNGFFEDSSGKVYALSLVNGISRIEDNRVVRVSQALEVAGMVESRQQEFWFGGKQGITRISAAALARAESDSETPIDYAVFGRTEGLNTKECGIGYSNIAIAPDDRLWVATLNGVAMLDLRSQSHNSHKPAIFVDQVDIGRATQSAGTQLTLLPGAYHIVIHFTAVELASPENVHLQYRLDGVDPAWLDADATRTALYTAIPAGKHTFHVRASNGDGIWDRAGISYDIAQEPYFFQTSWFWASVVAASVGLLALLYVLRVRQITGRLQGRLEERISERERIARELHDTLLQGFNGLILRIHGAAKSIPADQPARGLIDQALNRADEVMDEARDRVRDLRVNHNPEGDLARAFSLVAEELADDQPAAFELAVEGTPQNLHLIVHDELCQIGREALLNAFFHANARKIDVEIIYSSRELRLRFKDDGRGIEPGVLEAGGRPAHWGLCGMRERSKKIGARFDLRSRLGVGTEVELVIPSSTAYKHAEGARKPRFLSWLRG